LRAAYRQNKSKQRDTNQRVNTSPVVQSTLIKMPLRGFRPNCRWPLERLAVRLQAPWRDQLERQVDAQGQQHGSPALFAVRISISLCTSMTAHSDGDCPVPSVLLCFFILSVFCFLDLAEDAI